MALERTISQLANNMDQRNAVTENRFKNMEASMRNVEHQVGQIASSSQKHIPGTLPSNTVPNPKGVNACFTRSGGVYGLPEVNNEKIAKASLGETLSKEIVVESEASLEETLPKQGKEEGDFVQTPTKKVTFEDVDPEKINRDVHSKVYQKEKWTTIKTGSTKQLSMLQRAGILNNPGRGEAKEGTYAIPNTSMLPYPIHKKAQPKLDDSKFGKFIEMFKQLHVSIPLAEALANMPVYAKFLKDIMGNKDKLENFGNTCLAKECSSIIQNKLPEKLKDQGSITIPCAVGKTHFPKVLCDLGSAVNLMPLSIFRELNIGKLVPTSITLQLADRSIKHPAGVVEDVLVRVDKFTIPADFVVLEMEEGHATPILLGRPFLRTCRANINCFNGEVSLKINDESVMFNIENTFKMPCEDYDDCFQCDIMDEIVENHMQECFVEDPY